MKFQSFETLFKEVPKFVSKKSLRDRNVARYTEGLAKNILKNYEASEGVFYASPYEGTMRDLELIEYSGKVPVLSSKGIEVFLSLWEDEYYN